MGLEAIYPKPRLSQPAEGHTIYPYLLRGVPVTRINQVWSADITYIRLQSGFVYLVAVHRLVQPLCAILGGVDHHGRARFASRRSAGALSRGQPEIFNTDQGAQFTSRAFTERLKPGGVRISMDGRGRALDNVFVERLWRTVKYEEVYLRDDQSVRDARQGLTSYFAFYNQERLHQALGYRTPAAVYLGGDRDL